MMATGTKLRKSTIQRGMPHFFSTTNGRTRQSHVTKPVATMTRSMYLNVGACMTANPHSDETGDDGNDKDEQAARNEDHPDVSEHQHDEHEFDLEHELHAAVANHL